MKKIILLIVGMLLGASSFAQSQAPGRTAQPVEAHKNHAFYLGLKAGLDLTTMTQPKESKLYKAMGVGYSAGVVAKARFNSASPSAPAGTGLLGLGIELKYKLNSVKTIGTSENGKENCDMNLGYFEIPLYLQLFPFYKSDAMNTFYFEAGPDFAILASKSPKTLSVFNTTPGVPSVTYDIGALKGGDVRVLVGLGYDFPIKNSNHVTTNLIGLNARYYIGTSSLANNFKSKMNTFEISLSWMFGIGRI